MDMVSQVMMRANMEALKEPRGFIKFIEVIIAIFAFATTTSYSSVSSFTVPCPDEAKSVSIKLSYPFKLDQNDFDIPVCNETTGSSHPYGNFSSSAQFYVFIGVMAFLYAIAALVLYIFFDDKYRDDDRIPLVDFLISVGLTLFWLISAAAWAQGVADLKYYSSWEEITRRHVTDCTSDIVCTGSNANFASLNVSLIFGFLNMGVWGGNLWFLFKETKWHKQPADSAIPTPAGMSPSGTTEGAAPATYPPQSYPPASYPPPQPQPQQRI